MADHGPVEYATATGNDLPAHEATYESFVQFTYAGGALIANIVIGLAVGAVAGHWLLAFALFLFAALVALHGFATGAKLPSAIMVALSLLSLAFAAAG